jgi:G:T-mismatch repair DNA endonuclease (very short patch repair protein)
MRLRLKEEKYCIYCGRVIMNYGTYYCSFSCRSLHINPMYRKDIRRKQKINVRKACKSPIRNKKISDALRGREITWRDKLSKGTKNYLASLSDKERRELLLKRIAGSKVKPNQAELKLETILKKNFPRKFKLNVKGTVVIGNKIPDFVQTNGKKALVELFGSYWHGRKFTGKKPLVAENSRKAHFAVWGFKTAIIWEHELKDEGLVVKKVKKVLR